ncbi:RNA polymerase sigma factor [Negadavirga shengliensis]|uniref:RNA polymerase sigma factor n=1 Tax=Negadavirga shengliensis TaxID=1389218 RepID=A0ABV9SZS7_9BACT
MTTDFDKDKIKSIQQAIRNGTSVAFAPLVTHYQRYVFHIALGILKSREEAEEVTQDVFVKVYHVLGSFNGESRFSTWLYRITHNMSLNRLSKLARNPVKILEWTQTHMEIPGSGKASWEQMVWEDRKKFISYALERLLAEERLIITLYYMHEQSLQEIAEITGIPANTSKVKLHRARKKLEKELAVILKEEVNDL